MGKNPDKNPGLLGPGAAAMLAALLLAAPVAPAAAQTSPGQSMFAYVGSFTTAQRKVLGVAAPSQQQVPLNWVYPSPPNPYNLQQRLMGYVNQIYVQATNASQVQPAVAEVTDILTRRHHIRPGQVNDFSVRNLSQIAETAESSSRIMAPAGCMCCCSFLLNR